jgi:Tfp pilus assembly protein PilN
MILAKNSVGIEICGNDLRLAATRSQFGKLRLNAVHSIPGFTALSDEERKKALRTLIKNHRIPTGRVYLTVPREQGIVRQVDLPVEMAQKLADVVKIQVETLSPWPLEEIYWDFGQEAPKKGRKLITVTIAIVPRTMLDPWIEFFKSVGAPLSGATLSSLAYAHGASTLWKDTRVNLILHREESSFEGVVVNQSRVAALSTPFGEGFDTRAFVERLLSVAKLPSAEGSRVLVCGGSLDAAAAEENPVLPLENARAQSAADFGPVATALSSIKGSAFSSNLIPRELRYRENQLKLIPTFVLVALAIFVGLMLLAREPYQLMAYASRLDGEIQRIAPAVSQVASQESELNGLSARSRAVASVLQSQDHNLEALRELTRLLPASAFLVSYAYQDGTVTVSGFAQSASEIQSLVENSPMFKGAEFTNSVTREANGKDRFSLKAVIEVSQ